MLYVEDFEDERAQNWGDSVGNWTIEEEGGNHYWRGTGPVNYPQSWLQSNGIDINGWTDYAFETRVRFVSGTLFMCARASTGNAFYTFYLDSNNDSVGFAEYDPDQKVDWGGYDINKHYTIRQNQWYTFRFDLVGNMLSLYIDDKLVSAIQANLPLVRKSGGIGFYMGGGNEIHFDDIRVWKLSP